jgi:hypothetical protein
MHGWWFRDPDGLRQRLLQLGLLDDDMKAARHG